MYTELSGTGKLLLSLSPQVRINLREGEHWDNCGRVCYVPGAHQYPDAA